MANKKSVWLDWKVTDKPRLCFDNMHTVFTDALTGSSQGTLELAVEHGSQDDSQ